MTGGLAAVPANIARLLSMRVPSRLRLSELLFLAASSEEACRNGETDPTRRVTARRW